MQVYQIVRYNFVSTINGRKHRERTLGPLVNARPEDGVATLTHMLDNGHLFNIERRVK